MSEEPEKKKERDFVSTGVPGLDKALGGGFVKNNSILLCGPAGSGKTTLSFQFLCRGVESGYPGAYISFDEDSGRLINNMAQFGWDIQSFQKKDQLRIQKVGALEVQQFASQESILLIEIIRSIGAKRVVVDSLTSYELLFKEDYERMIYVKRLVDEVINRGCTLMATSEAIPGRLSRFQIAEFIFDTVINMEIERGLGGARAKRTIEVIKNRGAKHALGRLPMEITEAGIEVEFDR